MSLESKVNSLVNGLRSRNDETRFKSCKEFQQFLNGEFREQKQDEIINILDFLMIKLSDFISSPDVNEKKAACLIIDNLLGLELGDKNFRNTKFIKYLTVLILTKDYMVIDLSVSLCGKLITTSGIASTVDFAELVVRKAFDWLNNDKNPSVDITKYAAVCILGEISLALPSYFYQMVVTFFESILNIFSDPNYNIRMKAASALRSVLILASQRDNQLEDRPSYYMDCFKKCEDYLSEPQKSDKKLNRDDVLHGGMLILSELLRCCNLNSESDFNKMKLHLSTLVDESNLQNMESGKKKIKHFNSEMFLPSNFEFEIVENIHIKSIITSQFSRICILVLLQKNQKMNMVSTQQLFCLPRLSSLNSMTFFTNHFDETLRLFLNLLKEDKRMVLMSIGYLCLALKGNVKRHFDLLINTLKQLLNAKDSKKQKSLYLEPSIALLITMLAKAVCRERDNYINYFKELIELLFSTDLSRSLIFVLKELTTIIPELRTDIQDNLLHLLANVLTGKPLRHPGAPSLLITTGIRSSTTVSGSQHDPTDPIILSLALKTLGTFNFEGFSLVQFLTYSSNTFLIHENKDVRIEASLTCIKLLSPSLNILADTCQPQSTAALSLTIEILTKLLNTAVVDIDYDVRYSILSHLDERFDVHLAQPERLSMLFIGLYDERPKIRECVLSIIGRLCFKNPAYVMPFLRKILIQILSELEYSGTSINEESSARMIGCLVSTATHLVHPYVLPIVNCLLPKLRANIGSGSLAIALMRALGDMSLVAGPDLMKWSDEIIVILLEIMQDSIATTKKEVAVTTFSQIIENTGYVVVPYAKYPNLLDILLSYFRTDQPISIKLKASKLLGILGALDPHKHRIQTGVLSLTTESGAVLSMSDTKLNIDINATDLNANEMLVNMSPSSTLDDYYPAITISVLMRCLRDPSMQSAHLLAIMSVSYIFKYLGNKCVPFLGQVVPTYLISCRQTSDMNFRELIFQQLGTIVSIVKFNIRIYLDDIIQLVKDFWSSSNASMQCKIVEMLENIVMAIRCEFRSYLTHLIPFILNTLTADTKSEYVVVDKLLITLRVFGKNLEDFAHFLLPPILKIFDNADAPLASRKLAIETIDSLIGCIDLTDFASRILQTLVRSLESSQDMQLEAMNCLCSMARQLGHKYVIFEPLVGPVLKSKNIVNHRYDLLWKRIKEQSVLKVSDELIDDDFIRINESQRRPSTSLDPADLTLYSKPSQNFNNLQKVWASAKRVSRDDWFEWLQRFVLELFRQSPSPALRSVSTLANQYNFIAKELFNPAFVSCWKELSEVQQHDLISNLESALKIPDISEITLTILNLMEFMEHCDKGITEISSNLLCECAMRTKAYAKALHIKEEEFHAGVNNQILESLISINNKLQQPEAAHGVLEYARSKHRNDLTVYQRWYEKLHKWDEALQVYEGQQQKDPTNSNFLLGRMRCLEALGEWTKLQEVTASNWSTANHELKQNMARMSANAAWGLGSWSEMEEYSKLIPPKTYDSFFYMSVINIHSDEFNSAKFLIDEARNILVNDLSTLAAESYNRAYSVMVNMQVLSELEEVIEYKQNPDRRQILKSIWWDRIQGCQNVLEDWQKLLRIRSLVIEPRKDLKTWLKFCSLCRKNNRNTLAGHTINLLLGYEANKIEASKFENVDPHVLFAYFKCSWNDGMPEKKQLESFTKLKNFVDELSLRNPPNKVPDDINILLAKCYLKLGEWQETLKSNNENSFIQIVSYYQQATKHNHNCYKAWHAYAYSNYEAVAALKEKSLINKDEYDSEKSPEENKAKALMFCIASVHAFIQAIALSPTSSLQDTLRLLTLCFEYGHWEKVNSALTEGFKIIHINNWIQVIPQIIARIDTPKPLIAQLLIQLLKEVGQKHPQALIYPLTVVSKSTQLTRWTAANSILISLKEHYANLVNQAMLVSEELIRVAILWHELWHEGLEEASRLYFGERNVKGMLDILEPLHKMLDAGPQTLKETSFMQLYGRDLSDANECCKKYHSSRNVKDITQAWDLYYHVFRRITKQLPQLTSLEMQYVSPKLLECTDMELVVPGTYDPSNPTITIHKFHSNMQVITSKQRPRKLGIFGSNGQEYQFLLKGHEDLRQDERVMQSFGLVNSFLLANPETLRHNLTIQRFSVIPLSTNSGLIGWVPNCDTLHSLIRDYRDRKKILLNIEHRIMLRMAPDYDHLMLMQKVEVFEHALDSTNGDDLAKILWSKSPSCEVWFERRTNYTRSLAVMSMVGYVLGLGDRHPSNLMLDRVSGKIMHIDFGDCFEVAMTREKFPEKIPFRLTRMLINAMEVTGIEGNYKITCERVMRVLRSHKDSVMAVLEAFIYDPLLNWRIIEAPTKDSMQKNALTPQIKDKYEVSYKSLRCHYDPPTNCDAPTEEVNKKALAIINRVRDKLTGRDFLHENKKTPIDIPNQVLHLVAQATSHENLCQCYIGWCPFW